MSSMSVVVGEARKVWMGRGVFLQAGSCCCMLVVMARQSPLGNTSWRHHCLLLSSSVSVLWPVWSLLCFFLYMLQKMWPSRCWHFAGWLNSCLLICHPLQELWNPSPPTAHAPDGACNVHLPVTLSFACFSWDLILKPSSLGGEQALGLP